MVACKDIVCIGRKVRAEGFEEFRGTRERASGSTEKVHSVLHFMLKTASANQIH